LAIAYLALTVFEVMCTPGGVGEGDGIAVKFAVVRQRTPTVFVWHQRLRANTNAHTQFLKMFQYRIPVGDHETHVV
jgi:hypothetical protein